MHDQSLFDAMAHDVMPDSSSTAYLLLDPGFRIRGCNSAYERVSLRSRKELIGQWLFDAFPDNPDDPQASGTHNLQLSIEAAIRAGSTHNMWVQRYDIADPAQPGAYLPKVWSPANSPVYDHYQLVGVLHRAEEITQLAGTLAAMAHAVEAGDGLTAAEQLHTLAAFSAALPDDPHQQHALAAENEQLRRALASRDLIGQAKGMIMERYRVDAAQAFEILKQLSQESDTRLADIAKSLIDTEISWPASRRLSEQNPSIRRISYHNGSGP